jgi:hypothetical protein
MNFYLILREVNGSNIYKAPDQKVHGKGAFDMIIYYFYNFHNFKHYAVHNKRQIP